MPFTSERAVQKIKEALEKVKNLSKPKFIDDLKFYHDYLLEAYPKQTETRKLALKCLVKIQTSFKKINLIIKSLIKQIDKHPIVKGKELQSYSSLLYEVFHSTNFADLMEFILPLQLQNKPGSDYLESLVPLLNNMSSVNTKAYSNLKSQLNNIEPAPFLTSTIGDFLRFYTITSQCLIDIADIADIPNNSKTLIQAKKRIKELAIINNESIPAERIPTLPKTFLGVKTVSNLASHFSSVFVNTKGSFNNTSNKIEEMVTTLINQMGLTQDKYHDTPIIVAKIKEINSHQDSVLIKAALQEKLQDSKYNYIRQCGILGFFTRYRIHGTDEKTSASWNSIQSLLFSTRPPIKLQTPKTENTKKPVSSSQRCVL